MTSDDSCAKYGITRSGTARPMMPVCPVRRLRAVIFSVYPSLSIEAITLSRVRADTNW